MVLPLGVGAIVCLATFCCGTKTGLPGAERFPDTRTLRVALVQFDAVPEQPRRNLMEMERLAREAVKQRARLVMFHEGTLTDYTPRLNELAEPVPDGPACRRVAALAKQLGCFISFGLSERDGDRFYITQVFFGPEGLVHRYRKAWLWREEKDEGYRNEHARYDPGSGPERFTIDGIVATCFICADGEAPRCIQRAKALRPQLVFYPNNRGGLPDFPVFGTRAREIGSPMLVTNRVGKSWVHACRGGCVAFDAQGNVLAKANREGREEILMLDLSMPAAQQVLWVSPDGDDRNPGTESRPFATLDRAKHMVRQVNRAMTGDIVVMLRGGTYRLDRTLVFEPEDSGTGGHRVIYKCESNALAVLSGGRRIAGWQPDRKGRWKAHTDLDDFRQLYVNGRRAIRAQGNPPAGLVRQADDGYRTSQASLADWRNASDIEFSYPVVWSHSRCKVEAIRREGSQAIITMQQPAFRLARNKEGARIDMPAYIENAFDLLDEPGEWYLDRPAHTLYYLPRPGEKMAKAEVVAPALERLIEFRGMLDRPVENLHFVGLAFADAEWLEPSRLGHVDVQANFRLFEKNLLKRDGTLTTVHNEHVKSPANVVCRATRNVRFERCVFTRLGGAGLDLEHGARDNAVVGCHFHDISGTAIQVGDVLKADHHPDDPIAIVKNNLIANNYIHDPPRWHVDEVAGTLTLQAAPFAYFRSYQVRPAR